MESFTKSLDALREGVAGLTNDEMQEKTKEALRNAEMSIVQEEPQNPTEEQQNPTVFIIIL